MGETVSKAARARAERAKTLADQAIAAYEAGRQKRSVSLARKAVKAGPDLVDSTRLVALLTANEDAEAAEALKAQTLERLAKDADARAGDGEALAEYGHLALELGQVETAESLLLRAIEQGTEDGRPETLLLHILLERGEVDRVLEIWEPFLNRTDQPAHFGLFLARALAHFGFRPQAESVLTAAKPLFAEEDQHIWKKALANIRGQDSEESQSAAVAQLFDQTADAYDENLKAIGNAGPQMIARMLQQLPLAHGDELRVLDAGCGTGLCAPYVRPYASSVHGCDVSVKMLELCKSKQLYDLLTRTDLNTRATYPAGPFDLVVSGDVLVYFGDLSQLMHNVADVLKPGGWFVFTIEDCAEDTPGGHMVGSSGRHAHSLDYVSRTLAANGFSRPKAEFRDVLRHEFRQPVQGRVVAAQKLAIMGLAG